jgi:hypothetical protein
LFQGGEGVGRALEIEAGAGSSAPAATIAAPAVIPLAY